MYFLKQFSYQSFRTRIVNSWLGKYPTVLSEDNFFNFIKKMSQDIVCQTHLKKVVAQNVPINSEYSETIMMTIEKLY